jgi:translation initiation factor 2B subunit (eIF-2B alpha/beta/delta family)
MKQQDKDILCQLIRDHEDLAGSSRAAMLSLKAFIASINELKYQPDQVRDQYRELADAIKNTRPKIIPLIHLIEEFENEMAPHFDQDGETVRQKAIEILNAKHDKLKGKVGKIIELGLTCIQDNDVIVVHTASVDVTRMICLSKQVMDKNIKVVLLKQDIAKTKRLISTFTQTGVELETVPEYALSHYIHCASKMFFGAISVTHDMRAIAAVGTANIASLCHFHHIPVYLFANTLKFSHKPAEEQLIHEKRVTQVEDSCSYVLTTYSHDSVDLQMVDYLVTEEGIFPKEQIESYVRKLSH